MNRRTCWSSLGLYVATQKMAVEESRSTELYLGLVMALDRAIMQEWVEEDRNASASCQQNESSRLIRLQETPEAISTLYPGIMRKVCYWVLTGPRGDRINYIMMSKVTELGVYLTAFGIHDSR
jgi:hypothetical protein